MLWKMYQMIDLRYCLHCDAELSRSMPCSRKYTKSEYLRRKYCSPRCSGLHQKTSPKNKKIVIELDLKNDVYVLYDMAVLCVTENINNGEINECK